MNWDDLKFFLAVCRSGSIRGAGQKLGVNHGTVSRRISSFEESLGSRLFDRVNNRYVKTPLGEEIFQDAEHLEKRLSAIEMRVASQDESLQGEIKITLLLYMGEKLLMEDFAEFSNLYPNVNLEILESLAPLSLSHRHADVAFRLCKTPPDHLVGKKVGTMASATYISRKYQSLLEVEGWLAKQNWIGWGDKSPPVEGVEFEPLKHKIMSLQLQLEACRNGMGICRFPCFMADTDPQLVRIPPYNSILKSDLWILSHPDMRNNKKIKTFIQFMVERLKEKVPLLEGDAYSIN